MGEGKRGGPGTLWFLMEVKERLPGAENLKPGAQRSPSGQRAVMGALFKLGHLGLTLSALQAKFLLCQTRDDEPVDH